MSKGNILILVEGAKTDVRLMTHLLRIYGISENHKIVSYNTNIYTLYNQMFKDNDPYSIDLLQLLKEYESDPQTKLLFDERYSDILLIFDLEPQDPQFSESKIIEMMNFFIESSDMGKLYINYPMVESFYHMRNIPDGNYDSYTVTVKELCEKTYKSRVQRENRNHDYSKFAVSKIECSIVINQNIDKAWKLTGKKTKIVNVLPEQTDILAKQLNKLKQNNEVSVLCTCGFYIADYNPNLIS